MGLVKSKYKSVATNSSPPPLGIRRQTVLLVFDTFEWWWDCCDFFRRWSDPDWDHHQIFLREKSALRQLGKEVKRKLGSAFDFVEMTLEEDLRMGKTIPSYDVAVLLQHDWPTVNENPTWLVKFTHFVQMSTIVPSYNCVFELFNKTNYLRKILAANRQCRIARSREGGGTSSRADLGEEGDDIRPQGPDEIPILRTILVDPDTDLQVIARRVIAHFPGNQIILKENFSAGKEGVSVIKVDREKDPKGTALQQDLEAHRYIMQSRSNLNQVISPSFVVQEFEPLFETSAEVSDYGVSPRSSSLFVIHGVVWMRVDSHVLYRRRV